MVRYSGRHIYSLIISVLTELLLILLVPEEKNVKISYVIVDFLLLYI